jgi:hypothetical protein
MNKLQKSDDVMRELWAVKDETAVKFGTVDAYFSHLRHVVRPLETAGAQGHKKKVATDEAKTTSRRRKAAG